MLSWKQVNDDVVHRTGQRPSGSGNMGGAVSHRPQDLPQSIIALWQSYQQQALAKFSHDLKLERRRPKNCRRSSILLPHTRPVGFHLIITSCLPLLIAFLILCFPPLSSFKVKGVKIQRLAVVGGWVPANQAQLFALVESDNVLTY